jgi:outer membrane protein TolC
MLALAAPALMHAQPALTLKEAVERALRTHPLLASAAGRIAAREGLRLQAAQRPNPRLLVQAENLRPYGGDRFEPSRELDASALFSHPFELGQKRQRRDELAAANVRRAELERELLARQIALRVRQGYWQAAGAQKIHDLLLENVANFQNIIRYHEARVREGAMAEADLLKVRIEGERLAIAANSAQLDADRARIQLFREAGQIEFPSVRLSEGLEAGEEPQPAVVEHALERRTEVKLARQAREVAEANQRLQRANARPDVDFIGGYKRTDGFSSVVAGAQIGLQFSHRNEGNIAAAAAEVRVAESDLVATAALVRAEVRAAEADARARWRQVTGLLYGVVQQAVESSRIAQAAYREGGADLLRLLDAERIRIELEILQFRTLAEYRQSLAALEAAMGEEP